MQRPSPLALVYFCFLLVLLLFLPKMVVNAAGTSDGEEGKFNELLALVLRKHVVDNDTKIVLKNHGVKNQKVELPIASVALLLRGIEKNIVKKLEKACAEDKSPEDWEKIFLSLRENFPTLTGGKQLQKDEEDERKFVTHEHLSIFGKENTKKRKAKQNAQLVQLLLSFAVQVGSTVGARTLGKQKNGGDREQIIQRLRRFVKVFNCLEVESERLPAENASNNHRDDVVRIYLSATFVTKSEEETLVIKFDDNTQTQQQNIIAQRKYNYELLADLLDQQNCESIEYLSAMIKAFAEEWPRIGEKYHFSRIYLTKMDRLLMAWAGISDSQEWRDDWGNEANLVYLLKRFGHGLARRLLESKELEGGYFQLHPQEKAELERYWSDLESSLPGYAAEKEQQEQHTNSDADSADHKEHAQFHYEDAICVDWTLRSDELNLFTFDKRIRLFLARYVEDTEARESLKRGVEPTAAGVTPSVVVKMHAAKAAKLIKEVERDFVSENMKGRCQNYYDRRNYYNERRVQFSAIKEDLQKFRQKFHRLTVGRMGVDKYRTGGRQLNADDNFQELKLLLSFVLQMGYTVGSVALGLQNGELNQLLKLHSCLERVEINDVYLKVQFSHTEGEENFNIKFEHELANKETRKNIFEKLNEMLLTEKLMMIETIGLLEYMDEKQPNETIDMKTLSDEEHFITNSLSSSNDMKRLMHAWSGSWESFEGIAAFYQLKRFGRDLGQRLLDSEQLKQGYFQLFPDAVGRIEKLVKQLKIGIQKCQEEMQQDNEMPPYYMHFEELMPVEFGLEEGARILSSVLDRVGFARVKVEEWSEALEGINEEDPSSTNKVLEDIFYQKQHFDSSVSSKLCRFDGAVDSALNMFSEQPVFLLSKQFVEQKSECLQLEHSNIKAFKKDLQKRKRKNLKLPMEITEAKLKEAEENLEEAGRKLKEANMGLEELQKACVTQKAELVGQVKPLLDALVNLDEKAKQIAKQVVAVGGGSSRSISWWRRFSKH